MLKRNDTVGVVVPMHNAETTIGATLAAIRRQTHADLDIVVVDNGSTDGSAAIVDGIARRDRRVRRVVKRNVGAAAARNHGVAATNAEILAFVDAGDLWASTKIEAQVRALNEGGPDVGLVYTWFAEIDEEDRIVADAFHPHEEGDVLHALVRRNFVGNGSAILLRRDAFELAGGFDTSLRRRAAQGCETLRLCLTIAEHYEFRLVAAPLVGSRMARTMLPCDAGEMLRSCELVLAPYRAAYPHWEADCEAHLIDFAYWLIGRALSAGQYAAAVAVRRKIYMRKPRPRVMRHPVVADLWVRARTAQKATELCTHRLLDRRAGLPRYLEANV